MTALKREKLKMPPAAGPLPLAAQLRVMGVMNLNWTMGAPLWWIVHAPLLHCSASQQRVCHWRCLSMICDNEHLILTSV